MTPLSILTPSARSLRAPLIVGTLIVLAVWLVSVPVAPAPQQHSEILRALVSAWSGAAEGTRIAVFVGGAYLTGVVVVAIETWVIGIRLRDGWSNQLRPWLRTQVERDSLEAADQVRYDALSEPRSVPAWLPDFVPGRRRLRQQEWRLTRLGLLDDPSDLFAELSALESETELRLTVAAPLLFLGLVLATRWVSVAGGIAIGLAAVVASGLMLLSGIRSALLAEQLVVDLLKAGRLELPLVRNARPGGTAMS